MAGRKYANAGNKRGNMTRVSLKPREELNIGPATPIGRGSQPLDPRAHDVARGVVQGVASILPLGAVRGVTTAAKIARTPAARKIRQENAEFNEVFRKLAEYAHKQNALKRLQRKAIKRAPGDPLAIETAAQRFTRVGRVPRTLKQTGRKPRLP